MVVGQIPDGSSAATPAPATGSHTPSLRRGRARDHTPARPPAGSRGVQGSGHSVDRQELMGTPDPEARLFPRGKRRAGGAEHPQLSTHGTPGSGRGHAPTRRYFRPLGGGGPQRVRPHVRQETRWLRPQLVPLGNMKGPLDQPPFSGKHPARPSRLRHWSPRPGGRPPPGRGRRSRGGKSDRAGRPQAEGRPGHASPWGRGAGTPTRQRHRELAPGGFLPAPAGRHGGGQRSEQLSERLGRAPG